MPRIPAAAAAAELTAATIAPTRLLIARAHDPLLPGARPQQRGALQEAPRHRGVPHFGVEGPWGRFVHPRQDAARLQAGRLGRWSIGSGWKAPGAASFPVRMPRVCKQAGRQLRGG